MAVKKIDDGRYLVDIRDVHGVRRQKIFDRQKDAKDFETAIRKERQEHELIGVGARKAKYSIDQAIRDYMAVHEAGDTREATIRRYNQVFTQFRHFCKAVGARNVTDFTPDLASEYFAALSAPKKDPKGATDDILTPHARTVNLYIRVTRSLFQQEVDRGHLSRNPFAQIKRLHIEDKHPDYLREDELQRFFEQRISRPYKYFFLGLLDTGMRFNECATLRWEDVDFDARVLHVRTRPGFKPKTKHATRAIPMSDRLFEALQELRRKPYSETLVFATETGKKIPQTTALEKCKRAARDAGIERPVKVHMLRASFASHLTSRGALIQDVSRLLGHHSIQETEDAYAYLSPDRMHSQVNLICHVEINITIK